MSLNFVYSKANKLLPFNFVFGKFELLNYNKFMIREVKLVMTARP